MEQDLLDATVAGVTGVTEAAGSLLASGADLEKTLIEPTQPYNVHLCWQVTYSCASKLHNLTNRLGRFLVS